MRRSGGGARPAEPTRLQDPDGAEGPKAAPTEPGRPRGRVCDQFSLHRCERGNPVSFFRARPRDASRGKSVRASSAHARRGSGRCSGRAAAGAFVPEDAGVAQSPRRLRVCARATVFAPRPFPGRGTSGPFLSSRKASFRMSPRDDV